MKNIQGLEVIKKQMEESIEILKEFHEIQLRWFEEIMELTDLDKVDQAIEDTEKAFSLSKGPFTSIKISEEKSFRKLMTLAWKIKVDELEKDAYNA